MLRILLCDDDPFFLSLESSQLSRIIAADHLDAAVVCQAGSAGEALTFIKNNPGVDLVFLDLDFGRGLPNGMDLGTLLQAREPGCRIVFTTNHQEMAMDVLKSGLSPFGFLEKGTDVGPLTAGLRRYLRMAIRACETRTQPEAIISLTVGAGETIELRLCDILYLEAEKSISHGITYHTINGSQITILGSLDAEHARLGDGFLRVHRSFLVAKHHILALKDHALILSGQQEIPCSLRMRTEVKRWIH